MEKSWQREESEVAREKSREIKDRAEGENKAV
jgi:hypothetical protein